MCLVLSFVAERGTEKEGQRERETEGGEREKTAWFFRTEQTVVYFPLFVCLFVVINMFCLSVNRGHSISLLLFLLLFYLYTIRSKSPVPDKKNKRKKKKIEKNKNKKNKKPVCM